MKQPDLDATVAHAPADIRKAVRQLSFAYRRGEDTMNGAALNGAGDAQQCGAHGEAELMADAVRRAEAVLFAAGAPLSAETVAETLPPGVEAPAVLMALKRQYEGRGVDLVEVAGKWRFQTAQDLDFLFVEERQTQKKLTQAGLETLAIIAYGQPVTRAEIEAVRGVAVSKSTLDTLMETGWIRIKGRRKTPGRPVTYGTTEAFLEHFGLESLSVLPGKVDLEAEGLLSDVVPEAFEMPGEEAVAEPGAPAEGEAADPWGGEDAHEFVTDYYAASTAAE